MKKRKKKYKSAITKRIFKAVEKIGVCVLILAFFSPIMVMRGTNAGFSDEEKSEGNKLEIGTLDALASYTEYFDVDEIIPGNQTDGSMALENAGSLDFKYGIKYKNIGGDDDLCEALILTAKKDGDTVYNKKLLKDFNLKSFSAINFMISAGESNRWIFRIELPDGAGKDLEKKDCEFSFEMNSWQTDFPNGTQGFADQEITETQKIKTGDWVNPGDVIINEIMWMGSEGHSSDEWIELRNMTSDPIDISGWKIEKAAISGGTLIISPDKEIEAGGYFLIANYDKNNSSSALNVGPDWVENDISLNNDDNGNILLKNANGILIDSAKGAPWPAGCKDKSGFCPGLYQSMERNDIPDEGTLSESWHTCDPNAMSDSEIATMHSYWDSGAQQYNCGTPGHINLSKNDPTSSDYDPDFKNEIKKLVEPVVGVVENIAVDSDILPAEPALELTQAIIPEPILAELSSDIPVEKEIAKIKEEDDKEKTEKEEPENIIIKESKENDGQI